MARKSHRIDMTEGHLIPKLLLFSLPLMASSLLQLLFNAADIVVVGKFAGSQALAAVSSTGALINLTVNLFIGLSVGANVIAARHIGANENEEVSKTLHTSMMIGIAGGLFLTIFGFFAAKPLLIMMDSPEDVIDLSTLYLKIYFLGTVFSMIYNYGASILRAKGDTKRPLYFLFIAGVVNVILNLILVIIFHLDVAGVAIATVVSQAISGVLVLLCLMNEEDESMRFYFNKLKLDGKKFMEIMKVGLPAGLQGCVFSLSNVVIQSTVNSFGSIVMAGNGAASNIEGFVYVSMNSFYHSCLTFTGQNYGAKRTNRILKTLLSCQFLVIITGLVLGTGAWYFGEPLLSIYADDPAVIQAGMVRLSYIAKTYFLCGIMDVMVGSLRGLGFSVVPMIVSLLGACALRLVWIATIFQLYPTMETLYMSYPVSWIVTAIAHILTFIIAYIRVKKKFKLETLSA